MTATRRSLWFLLTAGACLVATPAPTRLGAQEQAPTRRPVDITARDYRFEPGRIEVAKDDLVKVTVTSADVAYGFTIDRFRVSKRVPAGGSVTFEFLADQAGVAEFYSNLTNDPRHRTMKGELIVRAK